MTSAAARSKDKVKSGGAGKGLATRLAREAEKRRAADKARAEELIRLIERRKDTIVESFYDIGEALREILRNKYYVAVGYASFDELLDKRGLMSRAQAAKLIEVVSSFSRSEALALGSEKAYGLARLADATPEQDTGSQLAEQVIDVGGRKTKGKDASTRELAQAAREARARSRGPVKVSAEERAAKSAAKRAQAALRRGGLKKALVEALRASGAWALRAELGVNAAELFEGVWPKA